MQHYWFYYLYWSYTFRAFLKVMESLLKHGINFLFFLYCNGCRITGFFSPQKFKAQVFQTVLVFTWVLFVFITVLHLFTELFQGVSTGGKKRFIILIGFLHPQFLEFLSSGIEHGQHSIHLHGKAKACNYCDARFIYSCVPGRPLFYFSRQFDGVRISCPCPWQ